MSLCVERWPQRPGKVLISQKAVSSVLQKAVSCLVWMLGIKFKSSGEEQVLSVLSHSSSPEIASLTVYSSKQSIVLKTGWALFGFVLFCFWNRVSLCRLGRT